MYDTAFGGYAYLDIYWNLPVVEEEGTVYEGVALLSDFSGNEIMSNACTITAYDNGVFRVTEFLGENYTGANFCFECIDENVCFTDGFLTNEYGVTYLNVYDLETESYIQPFLYDMDSSWGDSFSACYLDAKEEAADKTWGNHAYMMMYSEDFFPADAWYYGYLDLYWDCLGTVGISSVAAESNNAAVEYYNLNGLRVDNPVNGIYIVKQGNKVTKQVIR